MDTTDTIHKDITSFAITPNFPDYEKAYQEFTWTEAEKDVSFFADGTLNIAYNAIDRHAVGNRADKVALRWISAQWEREEYTFSDLKKLTNKFANVLSSHQVVKGDRVFIFLRTIPERYVAFFSILKIGAIAGTLFAAFQEMALVDRLADSQAKIVITNAELFPRIQSIWKDLPHLEKVIIVERGNTNVPADERVISYDKEMEHASDEFAIAHMRKEDFSYMLYTSGTTGKPKGVVHAHYDILQAMMTTKYVLDVHDNDIYWCTADLGWVTGVVYGAIGIWGLGATQVLFEGKFSPENWYKVIAETGVTVWYTAPTAIRMLMGLETSPAAYDLSTLRYLASVGEPLNPKAVLWGKQVFGLPFHDTWWQTELGGISITNFPALDIKSGSMGKPFPGVVAAIINEDGEEIEPEHEGNLALKPDTVPSMMRQIWNNPEKFSSYFSHGWYLSGDRAYEDKDGYFWFVGRADDVINTAGERIGPFEIESALVAHPDVIEAGVIGKPDDMRGEIIKAFVVLKPDVDGTDELKETLKVFVKKTLAGHSYPREISFIDKLPKTRSGKIMRRVLKAQELGLSIGDTSTLEDY